MGLPWSNLFDKLFGLMHPSSDIDGWLQQHPNVRDSLVSEDRGGILLPYTKWSAFTKKTLADLDAANLWTLMDQKIAGFGGCSSIPP